jgi:hypothetical protein
MGYRIDQIKTGPADVMYEVDAVGTITTTTSSTAITGTGTKFTQFSKGDVILCGTDEIILAADPSSDTAAVATTNPLAHTGATFSVMINLGLLNGGIERTVETKSYESPTDQLGIVKETLSDRKVTYKIMLAQWDADSLSIAIPESLPLIKGTSGNFVKRTSPSVGLELSGLGRRMRIIPVTGTTQTTDKTLIVEVWKAGPSTDTNTIKWAKDSDRTLQVMLRGWPDPNHNNEFDSVGDRSLIS